MTARSSTASLALVVAIALGLFASPARAQADAAAAEAVFDEAKALMATGRYAEACEKFAESNRLDPGVGVLLYLGDCYEKAGRPASAWAAFREAIAAAHAAGQAMREKTARERAAALEDKVGKLAIIVGAASDAPGLEVRRDGTAIGRALWGSSIPVDPGEHVIEARAPGKKSWSTSIKIETAPATVAIPPLESEAATPAIAPFVIETPRMPPPAPSSPPPSSLGAQRVAALVVGGLGVAGLGVGAGFGIATISSWNKVKSDSTCNPSGSRYLCGSGDDGAQKAAANAGRSATVSDVGFVGGGVLVAGGIGLWIWSPRSGAKTVGRAVAFDLGPDGVFARGAF